MQQVYKVEDIREDYIQRQVKQICEIQPDEIQLSSEVETSKELALYSDSVQRTNDVEATIARLKHETTTIYSENPFMIIGENQPRR